MSNASLEPKSTKQGLTFNKRDIAPFRAMLVKSGFYRQWHAEFGDKLWSTLEKYTGPLA